MVLGGFDIILIRNTHVSLANVTKTAFAAAGAPPKQHKKDVLLKDRLRKNKPGVFINQRLEILRFFRWRNPRLNAQPTQCMTKLIVCASIEIG